MKARKKEKLVTWLAFLSWSGLRLSPFACQFLFAERLQVSSLTLEKFRNSEAIFGFGLLIIESSYSRAFHIRCYIAVNATFQTAQCGMLNIFLIS